MSRCWQSSIGWLISLIQQKYNLKSTLLYFNFQDNTNTFAIAMGATLFLVAQCILIAVWICIFHKQKAKGRFFSNESSEVGSATDQQPISGNFGSLFPPPAGILTKANVTSNFRDFNPYTTDAFQRLWSSGTSHANDVCGSETEVRKTCCHLEVLFMENLQTMSFLIN